MDNSTLRRSLSLSIPTGCFGGDDTVIISSTPDGCLPFVIGDDGCARAYDRSGYLLCEAKIIVNTITGLSCK